MEKVVIWVSLIIIALLGLGKLWPEPTKAAAGYVTAPPKLELEKTDNCPPWCANGCAEIAKVGELKTLDFFKIKACR